MYLRDARGKTRGALCLNLIQDNLYSNCIKQKKENTESTSLQSYKWRFVSSTQRPRKTENPKLKIQNPKEAVASCTTSFCLCKSFKDLNHCADKVTAPRKKGRSLVCGCKGSNFLNTHQIFSQLFSFTCILFLKYLQWYIHYYYIIEHVFSRKLHTNCLLLFFRTKININNVTIVHTENRKLFYFMHTLYKKIHTACTKNTHGVYEMCTKCFPPTVDSI